MRFSSEHIATFVAILFHLCGVIGILFTPYRNWFIQNTPLNLCLMAVLLAWNANGKFISFLLFLLLSFTVGMGVEIAGVQTGWLFGHYWYGDLLGTKYAGVPLLIGINWFVIVYCSGSCILQMQNWIHRKFETEKVMTARLAAISFVADGAILAVFFDWLMEPVAMKLGFWSWQNREVPLYNYLCWFCISAVLLAVSRFFSFSRANHFAVHLFIIQTLFFLTLRMYL